MSATRDYYAAVLAEALSRLDEGVDEAAVRQWVLTHLNARATAIDTPQGERVVVTFQGASAAVCDAVVGSRI